jgi:hypothetical protein
LLETVISKEAGIVRDSNSNIAMEQNNKDSIEGVVKKRMFYFQDEGTVLPLWGVVTLDKNYHYHDKSARSIYTIVINKGMEQSERNPIGERTLDYRTAEQRDEAFKRLLSVMREECVDFIVV